MPSYYFLQCNTLGDYQTGQLTGTLLLAALGGTTSAGTEAAGPLGDEALSAARNEAAALQGAEAVGELQGRPPTATSAAIDGTTGQVAGIGHSDELNAPPVGLENILPTPGWHGAAQRWQHVVGQ